MVTKKECCSAGLGVYNPYGVAAAARFEAGVVMRWKAGTGTGVTTAGASPRFPSAFTGVWTPGTDRVSENLMPDPRAAAA